MEKLKELFASRRLWAAVAGCAMAVVCFKQGLIGADKMVSRLEISWGVYSGSLGIDHAAKVLGEGKAKLVSSIVLESTIQEDGPLSGFKKSADDKAEEAEEKKS